MGSTLIPATRKLKLYRNLRLKIISQNPEKDGLASKWKLAELATAGGTTLGQQTKAPGNLVKTVLQVRNRKPFVRLKRISGCVQQSIRSSPISGTTCQTVCGLSAFWIKLITLPPCMATLRLHRTR